MAEPKHKYKLIYFDIRGRAEPVRMMMALAGQEYEEENISFDDWPEVKQKTALGFLPRLETEEGEISQSVAIWSFIASRLGFLPESDWDKAQSDCLMITANDLLQHVGYNVYIYDVYKFVPAPDDLAEKIVAAEKEIEKKYEFFAATAKPAARFLLGDKMTVADFALYCVTDYASVKYPETRSVNKWTIDWLANMESDEKFANYLQNRKPASVYGT